MSGFPVGMLILLIVGFLIYFGIAQRVLDRLRLSDRAALAIVAAMILGSFVDIPLGGRASVNIGGALIPLGLCVYLLIGAGTSWEWVRALIGAGAAAASIYAVDLLMGAEPETMFIDPIYVYPLVAGVIAYLFGRSRRAAFVAAVLGVMILDVVQFVWQLRSGFAERISIGGAGFFDAIVIAGLIAVLLAELVGETRERLQGGPAEEGRPRQLLAALRSGKRRGLVPAPERKPEGMNWQPDKKKERTGEEQGEGMIEEVHSDDAEKE